MKDLPMRIPVILFLLGINVCTTSTHLATTKATIPTVEGATETMRNLALVPADL
ncbi:MAG: hypothetical protein V4544_02990 [Pseudomonadota bacterium]